MENHDSVQVLKGLKGVVDFWPAASIPIETAMLFHKPRLMIAALRGGSGKTVVSLGLIGTWRRHSKLRVVPFKKGPDYIDAAWLALAARRPCYNLDPYLMSADEMLSSFAHRSGAGDASVIEGNRGLYDGVDVQGTCSTAELAKLLRCPVALVLDATKTTRTAAALVMGCRQMDPQVDIVGVILNRVAGSRHEKVLKGAIEHYCGIPVVGAIPRERENFFPERHMGLVPPQEHERIEQAVDFAAAKMRDHLDLESLWTAAAKAGGLGMPSAPPVSGPVADQPVVVGVIRDAAFQFYYPENLEALQEAGAVVQDISSLHPGALPALDALYIGGGFPETHVEALAGNGAFRDSLLRSIQGGLPVYAECGGLMFLCRNMHSRGSVYPMVGAFPFDVVLEAKPQGHGYTRMECMEVNPYFPVGARLKGHEFHYSRIEGYDGSLPLVFRLRKGYGIVDGWDGLLYKNTLAGYSHLHAVGNKEWARSMVCAAWRYRREKVQGAFDPGASDLQKNGLLEAHPYPTFFSQGG